MGQQKEKELSRGREERCRKRQEERHRKRKGGKEVRVKCSEIKRQEGRKGERGREKGRKNRKRRIKHSKPAGRHQSRRAIFKRCRSVGLQVH